MKHKPVKSLSAVQPQPCCGKVSFQGHYANCKALRKVRSEQRAREIAAGLNGLDVLGSVWNAIRLIQDRLNPEEVGTVIDWASYEEQVKEVLIEAGRIR